MYELCIPATPTLLKIPVMLSTPCQCKFDFNTHSVAVVTGVLDEKASASQVLGSYPEHTGVLYAPHIEETLNMLIKMGNYFHCQVREQAYTSLPLLFTATHQAFPAQPSGWPSTRALLLDHFASLCHTGSSIGAAMLLSCACEQLLQELVCACLQVLMHDAVKHAVYIVMSMLSSRLCVPLDTYLDIFLFPRQRGDCELLTHFCHVHGLFYPLSEA